MEQRRAAERSAQSGGNDVAVHDPRRRNAIRRGTDLALAVGAVQGNELVGKAPQPAFGAVYECAFLALLALSLLGGQS